MIMIMMIRMIGIKSKVHKGALCASTFIDNGFILLRLGGARNTFSLDMGALQK